MKKVLVIEIDITNLEESWTIAIQRAQFENRSGIERQLIIKRSSKDKVMCYPEVGQDNFVLSVIEETHQ